MTKQVGNLKFNNEWFGRNQWLTASIAKQSLEGVDHSAAWYVFMIFIAKITKRETNSSVR